MSEKAREIAQERFEKAREQANLILEFFCGIALAAAVLGAVFVALAWYARVCK